MFNRSLWLLIALVLLAGLAGLNILAFRYFWYWRWWWFDLVMHSTGGLVIGLLVNALTWRDNPPARPWYPIFLAGISALIIGGGWELFEFSLDRTARVAVMIKTIATLQLGWYDTLTDLLAGVSGALLAGLVVNRQIKNDNYVSTQS
ncbi:MAG: hypothetical protein Q7T49_00835 [bacterium]|nr:hypothetical protein [bacterium]